MLAATESHSALPPASMLAATEPPPGCSGGRRSSGEQGVVLLVAGESMAWPSSSQAGCEHASWSRDRGCVLGLGAWCAPSPPSVLLVAAAARAE
eukprot:1159840-Pelagomonas_calceolata.AAC.5